MYAEERLEQVEQIIDQLVSSEDQYSPLKSLLDSLPTLLKVDEAILNYRKKAKELKEQLKQNKAMIKKCSDNLNTYEARAKSQLEAATLKRDKDNRTLSTRLAAVQNSITQMSLDNQLAVKSQEVHIKQESNSIIQQVDNQLKSQISGLEAKLKSTREDGKKFYSRLTEGSNKIIEEIKSFEEVNRIRIETMQKQGRGNDITRSSGKDNLRNWLFREISARLDKGIENCKKTFDKKFKNLNLEYNQKLLSLRSDVEIMREGIPKNETSLSLVSKAEQMLEASRKMITQLAGFFAEGHQKIDTSLSEHDKAAEASKEIEEIKDFRDQRFEFFQTKRMIKDLEDRVDADLYMIQDNLKKAGLLAKETDMKADKSREELQKVKRIQSSLDMNKKSFRDKIKAISDKATAIEIKFAVIARQKGIDVKETDDKFVRVSVISKDEMSSFDPSLISAI
jgi:hypothetical protein